MNIPLVDLKSQYQSLSDELTEAVQQVMIKADFILGQQVDDFEMTLLFFVKPAMPSAWPLAPTPFIWACAPAASARGMR